MPRVAPLALVGGPDPEGSAAVAARIAGCPDGRRPPATGPAQRPADGPVAAGRLSAVARGRAPRASHLAELERASGRGTERLLRVARTIADLAGEPVVREHHLDEAAWFRPADLRLAAAEVG